MGLLRENRICPFVFERLKIRLNIVYCCEELPLSTDAEVTHRVLHPAAAEAVQVLSMGVALCR